VSCEWPLDEQQALLEYKDFSYELNDALRAGRALPPKLAQLAETLDRAINRCPLDAPLTVYRAGWWVRPDLQPGDIFEDSAFMSTARDSIQIRMHFEQSDAPARFRIDCLAGSRAVDVKRAPGAGGDEGEVLIGRGSRFRLVSVTPVTSELAIREITGGRTYLGYATVLEVHLEYIG
jgi:hypothetical protein